MKASIGFGAPSSAAPFAACSASLRRGLTRRGHIQIAGSDSGGPVNAAAHRAPSL